MRTNIVLDDDLVREALELSKIRTKRELVDQALREFVAFRKRLDLRELRGKGGLRPDYDHKRLRAGERTG
jgi:Arc/MetJ family transcription regulator